MKNYAIYTTFNDNYIEMGSNMLFSFIYNNQWFNGDIIILCDKGEYCNINEKNRKYLKSLYNNIIFKDDCYELYKECVENAKNYAANKNTLMCYYKAELCKKGEYEKKLYLDPDIIVNANICELFESSIKNAATIDIGVFEHEYNQKHVFEPISLKDKAYCKEKNEYFNCGVILINDNYINNDLYDKFIFLSKTFNRETFKHALSQKGYLVDQDIFNEILENVDIIPFIYQCTSYTLKYLENAKIIHYCGGCFKPNPTINIQDPRAMAYGIYYTYNYLREHKYNYLTKSTDLKSYIF